jgi:hypothetical protein
MVLIEPRDGIEAEGAIGNVCTEVTKSVVWCSLSPWIALRPRVPSATCVLRSPRASAVLLKGHLQSVTLTLPSLKLQNLISKKSPLVCLPFVVELGLDSEATQPEGRAAFHDRYDSARSGVMAHVAIFPRRKKNLQKKL